MKFIEKGGRGVLKRNFYLSKEGGKGGHNTLLQYL